jgi:dolichyl-phosphate-mannose--protein O-mannosyl transferase
MAHAHHASLTFDEGPHLAVGYTTLRTGDFRLQPVHIHPPLANALAALPLLLHSDLPHPQNIDGWEIGSLSAITDAIIWQYDQPRQIAMSGRFPILLLGILLGALIFRWAKDLSGPRAGLFALALYAFDPNFIAHSSLITTDMAAVFFSVATLYALERSKTARRQTIAWAGVGILLGLAQLAKVSALLLVPVVGISVASYMLQVAGWRKGLARLVRRFGGGGSWPHRLASGQPAQRW